MNDFNTYKNKLNIVIVGLGIIGGSYAMGLSKKGHKVYGIDLNEDSLKYAIDNKFIIEGYRKSNDILARADVIILAIYPQAIINFLTENNKYFNKNQIITDVCGVKASFIKEAISLAAPAAYISHHPMAGREKEGIKYADCQIFKGANFLITPLDDSSKKAIEVLKMLASDLEFGKVTVIDYLTHDKMIGFTSQLTHAIAVSLVNSDHDENTINFIGDSYRDLTRIAMINSGLWSELFLENKDMLLAHINSFEYELDLLKNALNNNDKDALISLFNSSTEIRKKMEK